MSADMMIIELYKKLYAQRTVLSEAPQLTIDLDTTAPTQETLPLLARQVQAVVSYLLGVSDVTAYETANILNIISSAYSNQPFWKDILLDYVDYSIQTKREECQKEALDLHQQARQGMQVILDEEAKRKKLVRTFAEKIEKEHFAINAQKLMENYFTMYRQDAKKAWETLTTNPGFLSPIITTDRSGRTVLSPKEAVEENKKIAKFLKSLKVS